MLRGVATTTSAANVSSIVSVKSYGVTGSGLDESIALQSAFNALGPGTTLTLQGLNIKIGGPLNITSKSGWTLDGQGGSITALSNMTNVNGQFLININGCTSFTVQNLTLDGNRAQRNPTVEAYDDNLPITNCQYFNLINIISQNSMEDGFYFEAGNQASVATYCQHFHMTNCQALNCFRNGTSFINAYYGLIENCVFDHANGTAPQDGVDVEANPGSATPSNMDLTFKDCQFTNNVGYGLETVGSVGNPKLTTIENCYFASNTGGGIHSTGTGVFVRNNFFTTHNLSAGTGVINFANSTTDQGGVIDGNYFTGNTGTAACIYVFSNVLGTRIVNNIIADHANGDGILATGTGVLILGNVVQSVGNVGILLEGTDCIAESNYIKSPAFVGIYATGSTRSKILFNVVKDCAGTNYIETDDADTLVIGNTSVATAASGSAVAVNIGSSSTAHALLCNTSVNLTTTQPFGTASADLLKTYVAGNIGGTSNDRRRVTNGEGIPSYTGAARPAATAVVSGQCIYNTTTNKPNWSDGTNWRDATGTIV